MYVSAFAFERAAAVCTCTRTTFTKHDVRNGTALSYVRLFPPARVPVNMC